VFPNSAPDFALILISERQDAQFLVVQIGWSYQDREELNLESNIFRQMSRRALLETLLAAGSVPMLASRPKTSARLSLILIVAPVQYQIGGA